MAFNLLQCLIDHFFFPFFFLLCFYVFLCVRCGISTLDSSHEYHQTGCFTADSTVQTSTGETRLLSDLRVGEEVLTMNSNGNLAYSKVFMFLDRDEMQRREFVRIETDGGASITATASHLIYTWHKNDDHRIEPLESLHFKFANAVAVGDFMMVNANGTLEPRRVQKITYELHRGVFAPLTYDGTIVVNSITASCYALVEKHSLAHMSFMPMRALDSLENMLGLNNGIESNAPRGIHWYASALNTFRSTFLPTTWFYQT